MQSVHHGTYKTSRGVLLQQSPFAQWNLMDGPSGALASQIYKSFRFRDSKNSTLLHPCSMSSTFSSSSGLMCCKQALHHDLPSCLPLRLSHPCLFWCLAWSRVYSVAAVVLSPASDALTCSTQHADHCQPATQHASKV